MSRQQGLSVLGASNYSPPWEGGSGVCGVPGPLPSEESPKLLGYTSSLSLSPSAALGSHETTTVQRRRGQGLGPVLVAGGP